MFDMSRLAIRTKSDSLYWYRTIGSLMTVGGNWLGSSVMSWRPISGNRQKLTSDHDTALTPVLEWDETTHLDSLSGLIDDDSLKCVWRQTFMTRS